MVIKATFAEVEAGAQNIINQAQHITNLLEDFHKEVASFVGEHWKGDANDSFTQMQGSWNQNIQQLNATLHSAARTVITGNNDLQAMDTTASHAFH